jgi:hypothetical protein
MAAKELFQLLRILDERDIPLGRDDIAWAFDAASTREQVQTWVKQHLTPASLLTKEELNLYGAFPKSCRDLLTTRSQNKRPSTSPTVPGNLTGRPLSDADFEAAIMSLEASTAAIEKQCQVLEAQKQALKDITARRGADNATQDTRISKQKKLTRDKAQLEFEINELSDTLQAKLQTSSRQTEAAVNSMPDSVERILEKDDRLLDGLQKLLSKLEPDAQPNGELESEVDRLCNALTALIAQEIRMRLDAAYNATGQAAEVQSNGQSFNEKKVEKQRQALRAELGELCNEIDGLATMAVDNQFRTPISRELKNAKADSDLDKARWSEYVVSTLNYLTTRLDTLADHYHHLHAHQGALKNTAAALEAILATPTPSRTEERTPARSPATPISKGLKPLRLVQAHTEQDPTTQLLRHFDIRVADPTDTSTLPTILSNAVLGRKFQLQDMETKISRSVSDHLAQSLAKMDKDVDALVSAVFAYSRFASVKLVDGEVEDGLDGLEARTKEVGDGMRRLDVDDVGRVIGEAQREVLSQ